jgi:hypothetical protein
MAQPAPRDQGDRRDRGWTRWLATGTFVLGLAAGVLLAGLLGQDPPVPTTAQGAPAAGAAAPTNSDEPTGGLEVDPACLLALNAAQDVAGTVDDLGAAAAALDAAQLDEVVRRLQPLQERLEVNTAACDAIASVPTGSAPATPTAPGSPTAPASPTG